MALQLSTAVLAGILLLILLHALRGVSLRSYYLHLVPSIEPPADNDGRPALSNATHPPSTMSTTAAPNPSSFVVDKAAAFLPVSSPAKFPQASAPLSSTPRPTINYASLFSNEGYKGPQRMISFNESRARNFSATLLNVAGYPLCKWQSICIWSESRDRFLGGAPGQAHSFISNLAAERETLSSAEDRDCFPTVVRTGKLRSWSNELVLDLLGLLPFTPDQVVWLPGKTYIIDTYLLTAHFDHVGARVVQSRVILDALLAMGEAPDRIMMFKQSRYPSDKRPLSSPLTSLVVGALGQRWLNLNSSVFRKELERWKVVCMESAMELRHVSERKFANEQSLAHWTKVAAEWNPSGTMLPPGSCPRVSAPVLVLHRVEGQGMRSIGNFQVLERVFKELGVCNYRNASVGSSMRFEGQAALFANYSLMISVHSSQLLNLIWSHPLSATLELRPDPGEIPSSSNWWKRYPSAFCPAYLCHTVFNVSANHGKHDSYRVRSFLVEYDSLKRDLGLLLARQRHKLAEKNCAVPSALSCGRTFG